MGLTNNFVRDNRPVMCSELVCGDSSLLSLPWIRVSFSSSRTRCWTPPIVNSEVSAPKYYSPCHDKGTLYKWNVNFHDTGGGWVNQTHIRACRTPPTLTTFGWCVSQLNCASTLKTRSRPGNSSLYWGVQNPRPDWHVPGSAAQRPKMTLFSLRKKIRNQLETGRRKH